MIQSARTSQSLIQPYSWQQIKHGEFYQQALQTHLNESCPTFFGYHLLKVGGLSCEFLTDTCQIKHQIHLDVKSQLRDIEADAFDLPFCEKSVDAILLMHQFDYCADPHRLLREADRVMVDDGYLILSGFEPLSFLGVKQALPWCKKRREKKGLPWTGRMYTQGRIKDWLSLLNYEVTECHSGGFFPFINPSIIRCADSMLSHCGQFFGSYYFIVARKRTCPLKPIRPHWKVKPRFAPAGVRCKTKYEP